MGYISVKKANCKNCYKCLKFCNVKSISYHQNQVEVIDDDCVLCGTCVNICPQNAKTVSNSLTPILDMLKDPQVKVAASIAPSYIGVYGQQNRGRVFSALIRLGFDTVEETAVGAAQVTKEYCHYLNEGSMPCLFSTCCPSVNELIKKHYPDLISNMLPVVSPAVAHAQILKARLGQDTMVVFIGPCLAKIKEAADHPEELAGVISFRQLDKMLEERNIALDDLPAGEEAGGIPSSLYPVENGIVQDVQTFFRQNPTGNSKAGGYDMVRISGLRNVMNFLDEVRRVGPPHAFVELNTCEGGCINGPLVPNERRSSYRSRLEVEEYHRTGEKKAAQPVNLSAEPDMREQFSPSMAKKQMPTEQEIRKILAATGKSTPDKELNCGACGYPTCRDKAIAVYQNKAQLYMCLPYISELTQSLSNVTMSVSPDYIIAVNQELKIIEMNPAALKKFGVNRSMAINADLFEFMDPSDFAEVLATHQNVKERKVRLSPLNLITLQTLIYVPEHNLVMGFIKDITEEEKSKKQLYKDRKESAEMAQKVIQKQMVVAQEIASLLGETTAETKVTLNNLQDLLLKEEHDS